MDCEAPLGNNQEEEEEGGPAGAGEQCDDPTRSADQQMPDDAEALPAAATGSPTEPQQATPIVPSSCTVDPPKSSVRSHGTALKKFPTSTPAPLHPGSPATTMSGAINTGSRRCLDETPLQEINQQLLTCKTVSTRKKRPITSRDDFTFAVPTNLSFPAVPTETETCSIATKAVTVTVATPVFASGPPPGATRQGAEDDTLAQKGSSEVAVGNITPLAVGRASPLAAASHGKAPSSVADSVRQLSMINAKPEVVSETPSASEAGQEEASTAAKPASDPAAAATNKKPAEVPQGSNIVVAKGVTSFVPMVRAAQPAPPPPAAGKAPVKVKALEVRSIARS